MCCFFQTSAVNEEKFVPTIVSFSLTAPILENKSEIADSKATGLILIYGVEISVTGTSLKIIAQTYCDDSVVKSGFKNFVVQRKKPSSTVWSDYYDYGDLYNSSYSATLSTTLAVEAGYQYRVTCKHYAKKNLFVTQSISNTSNVVSV